MMVVTTGQIGESEHNGFPLFACPEGLQPQTMKDLLQGFSTLLLR